MFSILLHADKTLVESAKYKHDFKNVKMINVTVQCILQTPLPTVLNFQNCYMAPEKMQPEDSTVSKQCILKLCPGEQKIC